MKREFEHKAILKAPEDKSKRRKQDKKMIETKKTKPEGTSKWPTE